MESVNKLNLFVISLKYIVELEIIDRYREAHLNFLARYYAEGLFIVSGPLIPRTGGIIIAKCSNKDYLEQILQEDPFLIHKLVDWEIAEFEPARCLEKFKPVLSNE